MVRISCSVKTHAFHLAEQLERTRLLDRLYTLYHSKKNPIVARFNSRRDVERISEEHIQTFPYLAPLTKLRNNPYQNNRLFDSLVSRRLRFDKAYKIFIGWSGMSLRSMIQAKKDGKKVMLERGSSHIRFQYSILEEEYKKWGHSFPSNERLAQQEEEEYATADRIVVPSNFVEQTFLARGIPASKLFRNNFGSSKLFKPSKAKRDKFTIVYVGALNIRKGLPYLFEAIQKLPIDPQKYDVWFIGNINAELEELIAKYQKPHWKFFGHVNFLELSDLVSQGSIAVQPSLEEGLSMVIPQLMAAGTPVIATTNTGGEDIITDGLNGYIVPIRSSEAISERITYLFEHPEVLNKVREEALRYAQRFGSWDQYGDRYATFLNSYLT